MPEHYPAKTVFPTVQALASQGGEIALDDTLLFDIACSNHLMMSPSFRGSDPYPCGSLTYRIPYGFFLFHVFILCQKKRGVNPWSRREAGNF